MLGGGVRVKVEVRGQRGIKGTTKPLMSILDIIPLFTTNQILGYVDWLLLLQGLTPTLRLNLVGQL